MSINHPRQERCLRLLAGLGQPAAKINTANRFDYDAATRIAKGEIPPPPPPGVVVFPICQFPRTSLWTRTFYRVPE